MSQSDMATALDWARAEGWNPGIDDATQFFRYDPSGFLMAVDNYGPLASISMVKVGPEHNFLGLFITRRNRRGEGHGRAVWEAAMRRTGGRSVGLDGVAAQQESYAARGFATLHRTTRYAGPAPERPAAGTEARTEEDLSQILALDKRATGLHRPKFLIPWTEPGPNRHVRVLRGPDGLRAAGVMRRCVTGWKIGPLHAEDPESAERVFTDLLRAAEGDPVMIDLPDPAPGGAEMARSAGLSPAMETARMWQGTAPAVDHALDYGIASLELG